MTTIVAFGSFDLEGARSWVIRAGLQEHGFTVSMCRTETRGFLQKYGDLLRQWRELQGSASAMYVVFLGHYLMPLAWWLGRRAGIPVVFDAFLSLYDTEVDDRRRVSRLSPRAWFLKFLDWFACVLADVVLLDTEEHKKYFVECIGVAPEKILVLPIGCRNDLFTPPSTPLGTGSSGSFLVEFHGTFIPLQGIETILGAAKILQEHHENVHFTLIGKGQTFETMRTLARNQNLNNVEFAGFVAMRDLPRFMNKADICLGIFGTTPKADHVIPNKAYEVIACGKPLLTGRTAAAVRAFRDGQNAVLARPGDPADLAEKILILKRDPVLRERIGEEGKKLSEERLQPGTIVLPLVDWLRSHGS